ncbi:hypothetical protein Tco_0982793 [Tanacetum coccineum]
MNCTHVSMVEARAESPSRSNVPYVISCLNHADIMPLIRGTTCLLDCFARWVEYFSNTLVEVNLRGLLELDKSDLGDDATGIYHRIFNFSGVRIPFSSFLLALIKHYRVHFSQLGPLGLNKVITFEVLCRSLQIEPTVTLFRVFQTLYKQGDWFSFAKRRAPSLVCIDDNRSCMKHWKSGFFLINRRAIPNAMVWRHPNATIDDPRPAAGSFNMADVCRLSAHVIKLRDMPEGVLVLSGLSQVWKNRFCDPVLWGADGNVMGIHDFLCLPEWTSTEVQEKSHLDAFTSGTASRHVANHTRSALAQSSGSTTRPSLFAGNDDESDVDDACVKISLVTPLRSDSVIPSSENQGGSFVAPTVEGSNSRGKGIMVDDAAARSGGVSRQRPSFGHAASFRDVSSDAIHIDFFPFSVGPYPKDGVAGNYEFTQEE